MSKLVDVDRVAVATAQVRSTACALFQAAGAPLAVAEEVGDHLIDAEQCGVESHGVMRILQYTREMLDGRLVPSAEPQLDAGGRLTVQAKGGIGIPAMRLAHQVAADQARQTGLSAVALLGAGHTGRLGAFAEQSAQQGCLSITIGGGNRKRWRMVAPYGGRQAMLPTNPYCIGIPGGDQGPVVIDIATSQVAGGWIYAARAAGAELPEGMIVDHDGRPSRNPEDYFDGGAILPKGGPLGYGLALIAELVGEALLGPVEQGEISWLVLALDCRRYSEPSAMQAAAEEILAELRSSAPAPGHTAVQVPGERERALKAAAQDKPLLLPRQTWQAILDLADSLGLEPYHSS